MVAVTTSQPMSMCGSYCRTELTSRWLMPGQPNTVSTTSAPPRMLPKSIENIVSTGISALRSACLMTTRAWEIPFALAVRT